ncbi:molybdopterin-guanine dinucleotide biosynthesis protein A [Curtobacterium pusillum]|uniref:Molybdopterin-guanine dinucleotide biosynthesis protein A n=1 Tax=Curtobacterium pusillum TaxID=69373 RepID=A0AAW3T2P7_9MICO|nr:NTP transferase domain-containing protein [Curtobacterium pusillum]MBA8989481.1 molybdopterin-guanine dinucleotide biosynthesis protein A [Curtobacterium pusillum]
MSDIDAVLLAGGRARRLQGIDKAMLVVDGRVLLAHALDAVGAARSRVVVGPFRDGFPTDVRWAREHPPFGGPVTALAAGLEALRTSGGTAPLVVVLATDLPAAGAAVEALRESIDAAAVDRDGPHDSANADGWVAVDPDGQRQPLLAVYRATALTAAIARLRGSRRGLDGASMRDLLAGLRLLAVPLPGALTADIDTPQQRDAALGVASAHRPGAV